MRTQLLGMEDDLGSARTKLRQDLLRLCDLISLTFLTSIVIYLPNIIPVWMGDEQFAQRQSTISFIRDAASGITICWLSVILYRHRSLITIPRGFVIAACCLAIFAMAGIFLAVSMGLPFPIPILGLRFLQFLPLGFGFYLISREFGIGGMQRIGIPIRIFAAIQIVVGLFQIWSMPPTHGITFLGARPFGTLALPLHFGQVLGILAIFFYFERGRFANWWMFACTLTTLTSGSRLGMLMGMVAILAWTLTQWPNWRPRAIFLLITPVILLGLVSLSSSEALSGREIDNRADPRLDFAKSALEKSLQNPENLLLGWGLGLGSSAAYLSYKDSGLQFLDADNWFVYVLGSFGLPGLLAYAVCGFALCWNGNRSSMPIILFAVLMTNLVFVNWEHFPGNLLLYVLIGWSAGDHTWRPAAQLDD